MKQDQQQDNNRSYSSASTSYSSQSSADNSSSSSSRRSSSPPPTESASFGKTRAGAWSLFALIFKAACLLLACLTLSFSQFQKSANKRRKRQSPRHGSDSTGSADSTPTLSPSCSSSSLACNCSTPSHCYCHTFYAVLRVPPNACAAQIRSSYLVLAKQLHPDKQGHTKDSSAFLRLQEAYEVLTNDEKRKEYDVSEGLLGWRNERAEEELLRMEQLRKLEQQRRKEEMQMEKIRKFEEDPLGAALDNIHKLRQQQQHNGYKHVHSTSSSEDFGSSTNGAARTSGASSHLSQASSVPSSSKVKAFRGSTSPTPAERRSVLLPLLAHLSVLALLLLVFISLPIKYFFSVILAQRRKSEWTAHSAAQHIHSQPSTPITA